MAIATLGAIWEWPGHPYLAGLGWPKTPQNGPSDGYGHPIFLILFYLIRGNFEKFTPKNAHAAHINNFSSNKTEMTNEMARLKI